ncbi:hypothetical protein U9087_24835 [Escherichia coli]
MDIEIRHCNNIVRAHITLTADKLNIKFAPNGTGKSTLSRAIVTNGAIVIHTQRLKSDPGGNLLS